MGQALSKLILLALCPGCNNELAPPLGLERRGGGGGARNGRRRGGHPRSGQKPKLSGVMLLICTLELYGYLSFLVGHVRVIAPADLFPIFVQ
jgi:hypothetical protein